MTECHCIVVDHPSGPVWASQTPDRTCPHHYYGQPWQDAA